MCAQEEFEIEVTCDQTGDTAYAYTPDAAVLAARTLCEDAYNANQWQGYKPTATFRVAGVVVRARVPQPALWAALGTSKRQRVATVVDAWRAANAY